MSKQNVVSARVSDELLVMIDRLAEKQDRSRAWIVAKCLDLAVRRDIKFLDFVQAGEDAIESGDYVTQEELIAELRAMADKKRAA
jgi:predicted transcriptional regulator